MLMNCKLLWTSQSFSANLHSCRLFKIVDMLNSARTSSRTRYRCGTTLLRHPLWSYFGRLIWIANDLFVDVHVQPRSTLKCTCLLHHSPPRILSWLTRSFICIAYKLISGPVGTMRMKNWQPAFYTGNERMTIPFSTLDSRTCIYISNYLALGYVGCQSLPTMRTFQ